MLPGAAEGWFLESPSPLNARGPLPLVEGRYASALHDIKSGHRTHTLLPHPSPLPLGEGSRRSPIRRHPQPLTVRFHDHVSAVFRNQHRRIRHVICVALKHVTIGMVERVTFSDGDDDQ